LVVVLEGFTSMYVAIAFLCGDNGLRFIGQALLWWDNFTITFIALSPFIGLEVRICRIAYLLFPG